MDKHELLTDIEYQIASEMSDIGVIDDIDEESGNYFQPYFDLIKERLVDMGAEITRDWFQDFQEEDGYGNDTGSFFKYRYIKFNLKGLSLMASFGVQYESEYNHFQICEDLTINLENIVIDEDIPQLNQELLQKLQEDPDKMFASLSRLVLMEHI